MADGYDQRNPGEGSDELLQALAQYGGRKYILCELTARKNRNQVSVAGVAQEEEIENAPVEERVKAFIAFIDDQWDTIADSWPEWAEENYGKIADQVLEECRRAN